MQNDRHKTPLTSFHLTKDANAICTLIALLKNTTNIYFSILSLNLWFLCLMPYQPPLVNAKVILTEEKT